MFRPRFFRRAYLRVVLLTALLLVLASFTFSAVAQANAAQANAAQSQTLSVESLLNPDGTLNTTKGLEGSIDMRGWTVVLDSKRGPVLARAVRQQSSGLNKSPISNPSAPDTANTWSALPNNGLNATVYALAVYQNELYVGGDFSQTTDGSVTNLNRIAKFDGTNWSALPHTGLNAAVHALAVYQNELYVGGIFTGTYDGSVTNLNHIAKFDGTNWSALPHNGLYDTVIALAVMGNNLYVGGHFPTTGDTSVDNLHGIAKFDGTNWSALPNNGLSSSVYAFAVYQNDLYVGGIFYETADGSVTNLNGIAKFDGTNWSALPHSGLNQWVYALAVSGSNLYVGGTFTQTADGSVTNLNNIAKFDGTSWSALPNSGLNNRVNALTASGGNLYVGGTFTQTTDGSVTNLSRIAKFDGTNWSALPNNGLNGTVNALAIPPPLGGGTATLYVGGAFTQTADGTVTNLNRIAKFTLAPTQTGPTFVVNTNADTDDGLCDNAGQGHGNQDCTLREAINAANLTGTADTIHFAADYTIALTSGLPTITQDATIDGETHKVILDGGTAYRILVIQTTVVNVNRLTFRNGFTNTSLPYGKSGAALYNDNGILNVLNSTFENNNATDYGGAIFADGTMNLTNSTFSSNSAGAIGGGVGGTGTLVVKNSTFSGNASPSGAGLFSQGTLTLINTIIANSTGPDCTNLATLSSAINNLIESTGANACNLTNNVNGNKIGVDPNLAALAYNGGVTKTFAPLAVSQAIDAGDDATCAASPVSGKDQRGVTRPFGAHCEMGAFEKTTTDCTGSEKPAKPTLLKPTQNQSMNKTKVNFDWGDAVCATSYKITVKNSTTGAKVTKTVTPSKAKLTLAHGNQKWSVQACNGNGCTKSVKWKFAN